MGIRFIESWKIRLKSMEKVNNFIKPIKSFAMRQPWITAVIIIVLAGGGFWYYKNRVNQEEINFAEVKRGEISQIVSVTGRVKPAKEVGLSFEKSGRVSAVYRDVGENVAAGEFLVSLDGGEISAQLAQGKAVVKTQEAKLEELKSGTREEDINVSEVAVDNAVSDLLNDIKNGYVNADDAIRNKVDQLMSNPKGPTPQLNFIVNDFQLETDIENNRPTMENLLSVWNSSVNIMLVSKEVTPYAGEARANLRSVQTYLDKVASAVNSLTTTTNLSQTTIDGYKAAIVLARTNVNTALDAVTASLEKYKNSMSALALKKAGTVKEQIDAQEAEVDGAKANVLNLEVQLGKTILRSPISGVVTKQEAKTGETAPAGVVLVSVISNAKYEIEADIPEADIAKIKIGDKAEITLDAYGSDAVFSATVSQINPAETIIDGVATYKTTLQFNENDPRVKPGMTANTDIFGQKKENILFIPGRAVSTKEKIKTVDLLEGKTTRGVIITTGLRGSNGDVEILSGLKEGDRVKTN